MLRFIQDQPAILISTGKEKILVISDLHIGFEHSLAEQGINIPSHTPRILDRIRSLAKKHDATRLFILGDVKHEVVGISLQEYAELPDFFRELLRVFKGVEIVPGNHDGEIGRLLPPKTILHPPTGTYIWDSKKKISIIHGHAWPSPELFDCDTFILGHNHLTVEFRYSGYRMVEPVWLAAKWDKEKIAEAYTKYSGLETRISNPKIILMPAFNPLLGGMAVNANPNISPLGPIFSSGAVELGESEVYLLDGTYLGRLSSIS